MPDVFVKLYYIITDLVVKKAVFPSSKLVLIFKHPNWKPPVVLQLYNFTTIYIYIWNHVNLYYNYDWTCKYFCTWSPLSNQWYDDSDTVLQCLLNKYNAPPAITAWPFHKYKILFSSSNTSSDYTSKWYLDHKSQGL